MTTYYKATFSNGRTLTRSTAGRTYSHAYLAAGQYVGPNASPPPGNTWMRSGWSRTPDLASKALGGSWPHRPAYQMELAEIAPAVEITGAEYRALKKGG